MNAIFGFLHNLYSLTNEEIIKMSSNFVSSYLDDVEESLGDEFTHFSELL